MQEGGTRADTATVLFTDLVGSTELRSRLGEESADELRHVHDALVRAAIEAHRGTVVKQLGDGVMATFTGAADGLAGAVAIQQAIDQHNRRTDQERLEVRIGLSVGDVTIEGDDCFGLPVVEAQRLEAAAVPGQILCSEVVQLMSRGRGGHVFVPVGALDLKGIDGPVNALEVGWLPADSATPTPILPRLLSTQGSFDFAGRADELTTLVDAWKHAVAGTPGVVLVSGEPGIGKTRLVAELARRALDDEAIVVAGRCDEHITVAYRPFVDALRQRLEQVQGRKAADVLGARAGELRRLLPDLPTQVTDLPDPVPGEPEIERYQLLEAIAGWVQAMAREAPVLLVLDDLHWAEGPTLAAMRHVVDQLGEDRVLVVGTYRDTDLDRTHPLAEVLADFRRRPTVSRLDLDGLTAAGVAQFLEGAAGHELDPAGSALAAAVFRETAGNPFFIGEVLRHLAESGALVQRDGAWTSDLDLDDLGIPEGIREVVGRRLTRLSDTSGRALSAAAIIGHDFEVDLVARVADLSVDEVLDGLDEAAAANLVHENGVDQYRFAHALVRTTLEEELSTTRRARLHRKTATALESLHAGRLDAIASRLAHHWAETADPDPSTAIRWATRAGQQNLDRAAPDDALRWFRSAMELLDPDEPDLQQRAELLVLIGTAKMHLGDPTFREEVMAGARQALAVGDAGLAAAALVVNPRTAWTRGTPSDPERLEIIAAARAIVEPDDWLTIVRLLLCEAEQLLFLGDREGRVALVSEAVEILSSRPLAPGTLTETVGWLAMLVPATAWSNPHYDELMERGYAEVEASGTSTQRLRGTWVRWNGAMRRGDRSVYDEAMLRIRQHAREPMSPAVEVMMSMMAIIDGQTRGRLDAADAAAARLVEVSTAQDDESSAAYQSLNGFMTARERGTLPELREVLEGLHSDAAPGPTAAIRAAGLARAGATALALEELETARPFDDVADDPGYPITITEFVDAAVVLGHADAARELYPLLAALDGDTRPLIVTGGYSAGSVLAGLGRLAATYGDHDAADAHFRRGIADVDRFGATAHQARHRLDYAELCRDLGRSGDARRLAQEALDLVGDGELVDSRDRALALLADLEH